MQKVAIQYLQGFWKPEVQWGYKKQPEIKKTNKTVFQRFLRTPERIIFSKIRDMCCKAILEFGRV